MKILTAAFFLLLNQCVYAQIDKAFIIGISQYTEVNSLKYADADATQYAQYLIEFSNYKKENVDLLLNLEAKKLAIEKTFEKIAEESQSKPIRNFIFVYAGHGIGSKLSYIPGNKENTKDTNVFLVPSDAKLAGSNFTNIENSSVVTNPTFITTDWLSQTLAKIKAEKITVILDSCYSGNQKFFDALQFQFSDRNKNLNEYSFPKFAYIASSRDDQEAAEYDELGHGALSYAFFEFLNIKRRQTGVDKLSDVTYIDFSNNVSKLFSEVQINGKSLDTFHQPMFLGLPVFEKISNESFIQIKGSGATELRDYVGARSKLNINSGYANYKMYVDGAEIKPDSSGAIELVPGRHLFEYYIPETGYRYSFVRDLVGYQVVTEKINHIGKLFINTKFISTNPEQIKDGLEIFINGKSYGTHKDFDTDLLAGTHLVEVKYLDGVSKKTIEIRPDSPLKISYTLEPKRESSITKSVKKVVF
jgi:hypothetical protein